MTEISMPHSTPHTHSPAWQRLALLIAQNLIMVMIPVLLTLLGARLVMGDWFLEFEYNRPGFPEDFYGFTTEDRLTYAPIALDYLLTDARIDLLADLSFEDATPIFNSRELKHMEDVKIVTDLAFKFLYLAGGLSLLLCVVLATNKQWRTTLINAIMAGSLLTLSIIGVIVLTAVFMWDVFFTTFHELFFESGTWRFAYSDSLIRLFPEQFWFDAALAIGAFTVITALGLLGLSWFWGKRHSRQSSLLAAESG